METENLIENLLSDHPFLLEGDAASTCIFDRGRPYATFSVFSKELEPLKEMLNQWLIYAEMCKRQPIYVRPGFYLKRRTMYIQGGVYADEDTPRPDKAIDGYSLYIRSTLYTLPTVVLDKDILTTLTDIRNGG